MFAPIVLFTYNRPSHAQKLLDSLAANAESNESCLYIYCDGPKESADQETIERINQSRKIAKTEKRFKKTIVIEQPVNKGLATSIIDGVTEIVNKHGHVIVLEDDLVVSQYFLFFMNDSLRRYENNMKVGQIGACNYFACGKRYPDTFFIPIPDCWGWATWQNRWVYFNSDARQLLSQLQEKNLMNIFNVYGAFDMKSMLIDQIGGNGTSWAVRWTAVSVLNNWVTLYPNPSMTNHIQSDGATNANFNILPPLCKSIPNLETKGLKLIPIVIKAMKRGYEGTGDFYGDYKYSFFSRIRKKSFSQLQKLIVCLKHVYHR